MQISKKLYDSLINIFMEVADAVDGGSGWDDVADTYNEEFKKAHVVKLYGDLIDSNPLNELIR